MSKVPAQSTVFICSNIVKNNPCIAVRAVLRLFVININPELESAGRAFMPHFVGFFLLKLSFWHFPLGHCFLLDFLLDALAFDAFRAYYKPLVNVKLHGRRRSLCAAFLA